MAAHSTPFPLRFCDTDMLGHVNNAVYATIYEAGRTDLLVSAGLLDIEAGFSPVIVRLEIDFIKEMNWPATVEVQTAILRLGNKSLHVRQRALVDGEVVSRSASVLAVISTETRRAVELRDEWRAALAPFVDPDFA
jgi:acyl-CoA thioester hydrolase